MSGRLEIRQNRLRGRDDTREEPSALTPKGVGQEAALERADPVFARAMRPPSEEKTGWWSGSLCNCGSGEWRRSPELGGSSVQAL